MTDSAIGTFEVKLEPEMDEVFTRPELGRALLRKVFSGDLIGTSQGQMLSARTNVEGSAGYVAIELVEGSLAGKHGSFVLQHSSSMTRGESQQSITVVPDSATAELTGLTGRMVIDIKDNQHAYVFEYSLP